MVPDVERYHDTEETRQCSQGIVLCINICTAHL